MAGKLKNVWLLCVYLVVEDPRKGEREARRPHDGDRAEGAGHLGLAGDAQWVADGEVPGEKVDHKMCKIVVVLVISDENTGCAELKFFTVSHLIKMCTYALSMMKSFESRLIIFLSYSFIQRERAWARSFVIVSLQMIFLLSLEMAPNRNEKKIQLLGLNFAETK